MPKYCSGDDSSTSSFTLTIFLTLSGIVLSYGGNREGVVKGTRSAGGPSGLGGAITVAIFTSAST